MDSRWDRWREKDLVQDGRRMWFRMCEYYIMDES